MGAVLGFAFGLAWALGGLAEKGRAVPGSLRLTGTEFAAGEAASPLRGFASGLNCLFRLRRTCKTLGAQQDSAHVVHGVCGMKTEGTEVVTGPVGTRLRLQAVEDLIWVYLLNVQGAHRALQ